MKPVSLNKILYTSLLLSLGMIAGRMLYTGQWYGTYLVWNLFLAWLPFAFSQLLLQKPMSTVFQYGLLAAWLLFFPNAPYIITDLFHLKHRPPVPYWYDLLLLFWAAWNGLLLGILSLMHVERYLLGRFRPAIVNWMVNLSLVLCAFGVYAGRFLRWNSWHVVSEPGNIIADITLIALHPGDHLRTWAVTLVFSLLMMVIYKTMKGLQNAALTASGPALPDPGAAKSKAGHAKE